ncbi:MAG TPA: hypothetical protein VF533_25445, partial [Solirubrobacteraceae bacterium]
MRRLRDKLRWWWVASASQHVRSARRRWVLLGLLAAAVAAGIVALVAGGGGILPAERIAGTRADANPYDGRSPRAPAAASQRVLLQLQRPPLAGVPGVQDLTPEARRDYVASLKREAQALRGALKARGVRIDEVVAFERAWNGFAATVRTRDLAAISSLGVRAQPVRRFYPALGEPVPVAAAGRPDAPRAGAPAAGATAPAVALLASGVGGPREALDEPGYDAVDRDLDPSPGTDPRDARRREAGGTALAGVLAAAGVRVRPIRVAGLQAGPSAAQAEEYATSDQLLAGLERAVDADGDGDTGDHAAVALVAVSAPYAGFAASPEAQAVAGARRLGTLVVAPAGGEGAARAPSGTVGSPAAARAALAVGALAASAPHAELRSGPLVAPDAAVLAGAAP